ncbi:MAG: hypothetical protein ACLUEQ_10795 [Cloacibacillus evryensis]
MPSQSEQRHLIFHKPKGVLCAVEDSRERTVIDILPPELDRFRLFRREADRDSEGLIILTNDGYFPRN